MPGFFVARTRFIFTCLTLNEFLTQCKDNHLRFTWGIAGFQTNVTISATFLFASLFRSFQKGELLGLLDVRTRGEEVRLLVGLLYAAEGDGEVALVDLYADELAT